MKETLLDRKSIYKGSLIEVFEDQVKCSNGLISTREIVMHSPAVVIIPIESNGNILLIKQYRHAIQSSILECPAGCVETNETPLDAAKRELAEECSVKAEHWEFLHKGFPTPGFCNEIYHVFLAKSFSPCFQNSDPDEIITISFRFLIFLSKTLRLDQNLNKVVFQLNTFFQTLGIEF